MKQENNKDIKENDGYRITKNHCWVRLICTTILSYCLAQFTFFLTFFERAKFLSTNQDPKDLCPVAIFYEKCSATGLALPIAIAVFGWLAIRYMKKGIFFECIVSFGLVLSVVWTGLCVVGWMVSFLPWTSPLKASSH